MINNISWADYCLAIGILLAIYYTLLLFIYFKKDINQILSGRYSSALFAAGSSGESLENDPLNSHHLVNKEDELHRLEANGARSIQSLSDEMEAYFNEADNARIGKDHLMRSLKNIIGKHKQNIDTSQREVINYPLKMNCIKYCSINLLEEEIELLWLD